MIMVSEYDPDDELAQWAGGFFNGEGCISSGPTSTNKGFEYRFKPNISANASLPTKNVPSTAEMAGLFDGEGEIAPQPSRQSQHRLNYQINVKNRIHMTTRHDIERYAIWIKSIGLEPSIIPRSDNENENREDSYTVKVNSMKAVEKVLEELFPYLTKSKQTQAYIMLEEILPRLNSEVHLEKRGYIECMSWVDLLRSYKGARSKDTDHTFEKFNEEVWPDVQPRDSHVAPPKEKFKEQLFDNEERETFEEKTGPSPRQPDKDWDGENDPFNI